MYYYNNTQEGKLDDRWRSHYRVIEKNSPVTCMIRNQLSGDVRRVNIEHLVKADLTDWPMPKPRTGKRKATFVVPPSDSSEDDEYRMAKSDIDEDNIPLAKLKLKWSGEDFS